MVFDRIALGWVELQNKVQWLFRVQIFLPGDDNIPDFSEAILPPTDL